MSPKHSRVPGHTLRVIDPVAQPGMAMLLGRREVFDYFPRCDCGWTELCASRVAARQAYTKHLAEVRS